MCIRAKVVVFGQKLVLFEQRWFNSGEMVVIGQSCCNRAKVVLIGQKWLFSIKLVLFGQKRLYSSKSGSIWAKVVVFLRNLLYS